MSVGFTLDLFFPWIQKTFKPISKLRFRNLFMVLLISLICGLLFYLFPIHIDIYGDSERFQRLMGLKTDALLPYHLDNLFSINIFHPKNGERTWLNLIQVLSYYFGWTHVTVFKGLSLVSGVLFIFTWSSYLFKHITESHLRVIGLLVVISTFCMQNFFGHIEIYGPSLVIFSWFLICWIKLLKNPGKHTLTFFILLLFLCIKSHTLFFLLLPLVLISLGLHYNYIKSINWYWLGSRILLPFLIMGLVLYFFVFKDYNDPMTLSPDTQYIDRLFLPLSRGLPPQDRYFLFSFSHFIDFFNVVISWSPISWLILVSIIATSGTKVPKKDPIVMLLIVTIIMFSCLLFVINPLLSLLRDWDLYGIVTPLIIMVTLYILSQNREMTKNYILGPAVGIFLLTVPIHIVHVHAKSLGKHYESIGAQIHKTYWATGSGILILGLKLQEYNLESYQGKLEYYINTFQSKANPSNDLEYANLIQELAKTYRKHSKEYSEALKYHQLAEKYGPRMGVNILGIVETHFLQEQYDEALRYSKKLIDVPYPSTQRAYLISIQCALEAQDYQEAMHLSSQYLKYHPEDEFIEGINDKLINADGVDSLKFLFNRSPESGENR